jgi:uncharacterized protein
MYMPSIEQARSWYSQTDPTHGFDHILRVIALARKLAILEGADEEIVTAAALLHDARKPIDQSQNSVRDEAVQRNNHHLESAEFAREVLEADGWPQERIQQVVLCIRAHRFRDNREPPTTIEARVLFDADKLDAIGAIGVGRAVAYAVTHGEPVYAKPTEQFIRTGQRADGEAHSSYHEFVFKLSKLKERLFTLSGKKLAEGRHQVLVAFYEELKAEIECER